MAFTREEYSKVIADTKARYEDESRYRGVDSVGAEEQLQSWVEWIESKHAAFPNPHYHPFENPRDIRNWKDERRAEMRKKMDNERRNGLRW